MMLTRAVLVFLISLACSIRQSEGLSAFNQSSCRDTSVPGGGGTIAGGQAAPGNKWPWLVAFFTKADNKFICGGSLISERIVLTAAHCIQDKNAPEPIEPNEVNIYLGKWNLSDVTEPNVLIATPEEFIIHDDWNASETRWDADIAIVKLADVVTFSNSIQPVCLWTSELQPDEDDRGMVVGWGRMENQSFGEHSEVPREVEILGLPITNCYENVDLQDDISRRGLCVGGNKSATCSGDSGCGLFSFKHGKWFLRGITSLPSFNVAMECNVNASTVFANVEKFTPWVNQVLDGDEQLKCKFVYSLTEYSCNFQNSFTRSDTKIFQMSGSHVGSQTNGDVRRFISYDNSKLKFLPITFGHFFPNLVRYEVRHSGVEEISRNNFADLPNLKRLEITDGRLKAIPVDAFYDLVNLDGLSLWGNQIEAIDSSTFIHNTKLQHIFMSRNKIKSLDSSTLRNNLELWWINLYSNLLTSIGPELLTPLEKLKIVDFGNNTCIDASWGNLFYGSVSPSQKVEIKEMFASQCQ